MRQCLAVLSSLFLVLSMSGCASSAMKQRRDQREKAAQTSKLYCEYVNGELFPDIEVALNLEMAKRCDAEKNFSISQYRTPSENQGMMYCCVLASGRSTGPVGVVEKVDNKKKDTPSDDELDEKK